tara:strand:+ start:7524 stop:9560 length:2037 start_codon:yes stop_codon:yes gene_type:complete
LLLSVFGCKNSPTFNADNELDPWSEHYFLEAPSNIQVELGSEYVNSIEVLKVKWNYPDSELYVDKFKIFRSDTDTSDFREIGQIPKSLWNSRYQYIDNIDYNGVNVWYKIQAIIEGKEGINYSESKPVSYSASEVEISASIQPFVTNPTVKLEWQYSELNDNVKIEIYSNTNENSNFELEHSADISDNSTSFSLDINQPVETEYFYKLVYNEIQSDHKPIPATIFHPSFDILNSSVFSENEGKLHIALSQDSSRFVQGNFSIDNYEVEILYAPNNDTSRFYPLQEINATFIPPYVVEPINNLQQENMYLFRLTGSRGNYKTIPSSKLLSHKLHVTNTSSFDAETNEIYFPTGSFNSSNSHFIFSSDGKRPIIVDVQNTRASSLPQVQLKDLTSDFGDYKDAKDAIVTSSSSGYILVWDPDSREIVETIPNYRTEVSSSVVYRPVDFGVISEEELLIAYGDVDYQTGRVNNYYVTIWNNKTETHNLIYQVNEESMHSYGFNVAYYDNTILIFYAYESYKVKLIAINKDDLSIQNQSSFTQEIDAGSEYQNVYFSNFGKRALLYTEDEAVQVQLNNHEVISSFRDVHSRFDWWGIKGFATAKDYSLTCYGGDYWYHSSPFYSQIKCSSNLLHEANILEIDVEGSLFGLILSDDGTKLAAVFQGKIIIYTFEKDWVFTSSH